MGGAIVKHDKIEEKYNVEITVVGWKNPILGNHGEILHQVEK